jgi:Holliday junction resolvase-like predicted endonuclease
VEAVTPAKRRKVVGAARAYAAAHGVSDSPVRFDVLAIDWGPDGPRVRHDAGAFGEG